MPIEISELGTKFKTPTWSENESVKILQALEYKLSPVPVAHKTDAMEGIGIHIGDADNGEDDVLLRIEKLYCSTDNEALLIPMEPYLKEAKDNPYIDNEDGYVRPHEDIVYEGYQIFVGSKNLGYNLSLNQIYRNSKDVVAAATAIYNGIIAHLFVNERDVSEVALEGSGLAEI